MAKSNHLNGNEMIDLIAQGKMKALDQVYDTYKFAYLNWAGHRFPNLNKQDFMDTWHDAIIAFYEQVSSKKLTVLHCELKSYLFTIGYRALIKKYRKIQEIIFDEEIDERIIPDSTKFFFEEKDPWADQKELLLQAVNELPAKSREILLLRFIEGKSLKDILGLANYHSINALSATISRSLKKLKENIAVKLKSSQNERKGSGMD